MRSVLRSTVLVAVSLLVAACACEPILDGDGEIGEAEGSDSALVTPDDGEDSGESAASGDGSQDVLTEAQAEALSTLCITQPDSCDVLEERLNSQLNGEAYEGSDFDSLESADQATVDAAVARAEENVDAADFTVEVNSGESATTGFGFTVENNGTHSVTVSLGGGIVGLGSSVQTVPFIDVSSSGGGLVELTFEDAVAPEYVEVVAARSGETAEVVDRQPVVRNTVMFRVPDGRSYIGFGEPTFSEQQGTTPGEGQCVGGVYTDLQLRAMKLKAEAVLEAVYLGISEVENPNTSIETRIAYGLYLNAPGPSTYRFGPQVAESTAKSRPVLTALDEIASAVEDYLRFELEAGGFDTDGATYVFDLSEPLVLEEVPLGIAWSGNTFAGRVMGGQGGDRFKNSDTRNLVGGEVEVTFTEGAGGEVQVDFKLLDLRIEVTDTLDFCPGNLGGFVAQLLITPELAILEAHQWAHPVRILGALQPDDVERQFVWNGVDLEGNYILYLSASSDTDLEAIVVSIESTGPCNSATLLCPYQVMVEDSLVGTLLAPRTVPESVATYRVDGPFQLRSGASQTCIWTDPPEKEGGLISTYTNHFHRASLEITVNPEGRASVTADLSGTSESNVPRYLLSQENTTIDCPDQSITSSYGTP